MARAVTDLPQPDSPTTQRVLPRGMLKLTPSTALTTPACVKKCACKSSISRRLSGSGLPDVVAVAIIIFLCCIRIGGVAQTVTEKIQGQYRDDHRHTRPEQPGRGRNGADILRFLQE